MNKKFKLITAILLFGSTCLYAGEYTGHASISLGNKSLDDVWNIEDVIDLDSQFQWGVEGDITKKEWPVSIYVGYLKASSSDDIESEGNSIDYGAVTNELRIGVRKYFTPSSKFNVLLGAGIANITSEKTFSYDIETAGGVKSLWNDNSTGFYVEAGANYMLTSKYSAGVNLSYSVAEEAEFLSITEGLDGEIEPYQPGGFSISAKLTRSFTLL